MGCQGSGWLHCGLLWWVPRRWVAVGCLGRGWLHCWVLSGALRARVMMCHVQVPGWVLGALVADAPMCWRVPGVGQQRVAGCSA